MAAAMSDLDTLSLSKTSNLSDLVKRVAPCEADKDSSSFSSRFMEKIFSRERKCSHCGASGSAEIVQSDQSMELYITEMGVVGKQKIRCAKCSQVDMIPSCQKLNDVPTDQRLRIHGVEVIDYIHKMTHLEVLHDLMELLHIAAVEDERNRHEKHLDVANFMMQKARRVCEEWCKAEYAELRYKKFLHLCDETLIMEGYNPVYPHDASDEYKEMYHMMACSFRSNRDKVVRLLQLMKESLFDNPSRPSFMLWVSIAMMHTDRYKEFKQQYDPRTFMKMESSVYLALKERYLSLNIPVGIKKIPVVFILFELPRFYHFVDFLTRKLGKKKPRYFLSDEERCSLHKYEEEMELTRTHKSSDPGVMMSPEAHLDYINNREGLERDIMYKCHAMECGRKTGSYDSAVQLAETARADSGCNEPPRVVTSEQFRDALVEHLQTNPPKRGDTQSAWTEGQKVVLKIETSERGKHSLCQLFEILSKPALPLTDKRPPETRQKQQGGKEEKQPTGECQGSAKTIQERKFEAGKTKGEVTAEKKRSGSADQTSSKKTPLASDKDRSSPASVKKSSSSSTSTAKNHKQVSASTQTQTIPSKSCKSASTKSSSSKSSPHSQSSSKPTSPPFNPFSYLPPHLLPSQWSSLLPLVSAHIPLPTGVNTRTAAVITAGPPAIDSDAISSYTISILPNIEITPEIAKHLIPSPPYSNYAHNPPNPPPTHSPSGPVPSKKKSKGESSLKKDSAKSSTSSSSKSESKSSTDTKPSAHAKSVSGPSKKDAGKEAVDAMQSTKAPSTLPEAVLALLESSELQCSGSSESSSDEDGPKVMNARRLTRMLKHKTDNQHFRFSEKGTPISDSNPKNSAELISYLNKCRVVPRPGLKQEDFEDLPGQIFDEEHDNEISVEIPVMGPQGEFVVAPMIFAYDNRGGSVPIMPVVVNSKETDDTVTSLELVGRLFGLPLGKEVTQKQKEVFQQYLEIAMAASRNAHLLLDTDTGAIKSVRTTDNCTVIRLNVTDILLEAAQEEIRSVRRSSKQSLTAAGSKVGQTDNMNTAREGKKESKELSISEVDSTEFLTSPDIIKTEVIGSPGNKTASSAAPCNPASEETVEGGKKKRRRKRKKRIGGEGEEGSILPNTKETNKVAMPENGFLDDYSSEAPMKKKTIARDKFRTCENCQAGITERIRVCSGCKRVAYCNSACQKIHWKIHKKVCSYAVQKSELTG